MLFGHYQTRSFSLWISVLFLASAALGCKRLKTGSCIILSKERDGMDQCIVNYNDKSCGGLEGEFVQEEALPAFMRCKSQGFWTPKSPGRDFAKEAREGKSVSMFRDKKSLR